MVEVRAYETQRAEDEISEIADELCVYFFLEIFPHEVSVLRLRHYARQVKSQVVCLHIDNFVPLQNFHFLSLLVVVQKNSPVPALRDLVLLVIQKLEADHVVRQRESANSHQYRRPNDGVKRNVVLSKKMNNFRIFVFPIFFPQIRLANFFCQFGSRAHITQNGIKPDVEHLVLVSIERHAHTPLQVTSYAPLLQSLLQPAKRQVARCFIQLLVGFYPFLKLSGKFRQVEEKMFDFLKLRSRPVDYAFRIYQLLRVKQVPTILTLVPSRTLISANRALSFHPPVC